MHWFCVARSGNGEFVFEVVTPKRVYYFSPSDAAAKADWMKAIGSWVGKKEKAPQKAAPSTEGKTSVRQERAGMPWREDAAEKKMKRWRYGEKEREREREREREKNIFLLLCLLFIIFEASNVAIMKEKEEEAKKKKEAGSGADNADAAEASDEEIGEGEKYICSFDYSANEDNELSFLEGKALETTKLPKITVIVALLTFFIYLLLLL